MGVLAIDPGQEKCGFAYTDRLRISLRALEGLRFGGDRERLFTHLGALLEELEVTRLLVGMPLNMDGSRGRRALEVERLMEDLRTRFPGLAVTGYDERLTTKEAEGRLREEGFDARAIRARKDSWSALVLLEDWVRSGEPA